MELEPFIFRREGVLVGARDGAASETVDEETLAAVNRFALRPLKAEDFVVFTLDLCNNQVDKHHSRFPEGELERINALVPGRPLMERHDLRGSLPRGTFFRSRIHREDGVVSVRPEVYVLRTAENEDFIRNIEGGVYRETSIGFAFRLPECSVCGCDVRSCDHVPGRYYDDTLCHFVMRDVVEVIEGSVVSSGSQGTRFVMPQSREWEGLNTLVTHRELTPFGAGAPVNAEAIRAVSEAVEACGGDVHHAASLVRDGMAARKRASARLLGLARELDGAAFDEVAWKETLREASLDVIHGHLRAFEARFDAKYPPQPVSAPEPLQEEEPPSVDALAIARG